MYTPFLRPRKAPEIEGVYKHKESGNLIILENMKLQGFIDGETEEPYDGYIGKIFMQSEMKVIKRCIITPETLQEAYERVTSF